MTILIYIALTIVMCVLPAGVVWLCNRVAVLGKLGPIMVLYGVGMVLGNIPAVGPYLAPLQDMLPNVMVPLAIPMMLFGCAFSRREAGLQIKLVVSGFLSVCMAVTIGYLLFGRHVAEGAEVGGIITGMYTGGTLNAAALQAIFRIKSESFRSSTLCFFSAWESKCSVGCMEKSRELRRRVNPLNCLPSIRQSIYPSHKARERDMQSS